MMNVLTLYLGLCAIDDGQFISGVGSCMMRYCPDVVARHEDEFNNFCDSNGNGVFSTEHTTTTTAAATQSPGNDDELKTCIIRCFNTVDPQSIQDCQVDPSCLFLFTLIFCFLAFNLETDDECTNFAQSVSRLLRN